MVRDAAPPPSIPSATVLEELRIQKLGVINDAAMRFGAGLTVVTGETGAGKTMVVTGLQLLFGARADSAQVRAGAEQAAVEGLVSAPEPAAQRVAEAGGELDDDGTLVLRRTVTSAGRSRAHAGGASVPVGVLGAVGEQLLAVHGQSGQLRLARPGAQRDMLDRYAGVDLTRYQTAWRAWQDAEQRCQERIENAAALATEAEVLAHGLGEIERVDPQPGEDEELAAAASRLAHVDALRLAARSAHDALVGSADDPAAEQSDVLALLVPAGHELTRLADADHELAELAARLSTVRTEAADIAADLAAYEAGLDADPHTLARVEERRAELAALVRRFGRGADPGAPTGVAAVLDWAKRAAARLAEIDVSDEAIAELAAARDRTRAEAATQAVVLTRLREQAAAELSEQVTAELAALAMPGARLQVTVRPRPAVEGQPTLDTGSGPAGAARAGVDEVSLELQSDPSLPPVPIQRGASGGELSRVMLAVEVVLADSDPLPTMVFDEIDAGIGGRAAVEVGRRLARLGRTRQVIVVTHLAQVAAFATHHLVVDRGTLGEGPAAAAGVTTSAVREVTAEQREAELARMLGGRDSAAARKHAAELLARARVEEE
jgi:DNA repair protein RecN (Recombination protein N)